MPDLCLAQNNDVFEDGIKLEKEFKVEAALEKYELVLKDNPLHAGALVHASRMLSTLGGRMKHGSKAEKKIKFEKSKAYALKSIKINPNDIQAHLAYVIALGLLSEVSESPRDKIHDAKIIYEEGVTMLKLDSTFAAAYFVLGKWHFELARLNWMERMACELFFGGLPEGISMTKAVEYLKKASLLEPKTILYLFGEAWAYHYLGDKDKAVSLLNYALSLPLKEPDDVIRKEKCAALLKEIQH
ncbi:MAG: hypothetical protein JNM57_10110 [Cyclobacteriaceae bacterium]|nr:hypothetical protein [Cyclobacteriaceae bacterium]